ncbi:hypothetical protein ASPACDRAFT_122432 [Aspergillus aculeatus ATCC 16872]|uniref:Uncharacterized protein n=1 Tax=Aspergillus aculeatus (strain ATCC 16872 / CBS 172.66 / WB 5094) TaxID=690307 RepID=A0A1L9WRD0_ASPA1|nr:uncharacterized protein ASPACDRAFT_122432 [Aspergillus aculeatus ATCC 16872]OJJ98567.1 hypothetical protein ASPACDRAFT_122432 [Aspergillus aculeatus ATCC 16872]
MANTTSSKPHLWEDDLSDEADKERRVLAEWASTIPFKSKADDFQVHESEEFQKRIVPLLHRLQLPYKVRLSYHV